MKNRILFLLLSVLGLASCASLNEYYNGQYQDGIYYRPTPGTRLYSEADFAAMAAKNLVKGDSLRLEVPKSSSVKPSETTTIVLAPIALDAAFWAFDFWWGGSYLWHHPYRWASSWYWGPWYSPLCYDPFFDPWFGSWGWPYWYGWGGFYSPWYYHNYWHYPYYYGYHNLGWNYSRGVFTPRSYSYGRGNYSSSSSVTRNGEHGAMYRGGSVSGGHGMGYSAPSRSINSGSSINRSGSSASRQYSPSSSSLSGRSSGSVYRDGGTSRSSSYSSPSYSRGSYSGGSHSSGGYSGGGHSGGGGGHGGGGGTR